MEVTKKLWFVRSAKIRMIDRWQYYDPMPIFGLEVRNLYKQRVQGFDLRLYVLETLVSCCETPYYFDVS